jgi:hypothetical protein
VTGRVNIEAMRIAWIVVVVAGCGGDSNSPSRPVTETETARLDLPRVDDAGRVFVLDRAKPAALVWVGATGQLAVGKGAPAWSGDLASKDRADVEVGQLRHRVLESIVDARGPAAQLAKLELERDSDDTYLARRAAIAQAQASGILGAPGGADDEPGRGRLPASSAGAIAKLDPTAPLVIATPSAPAPAIVRVLRRTGGVIAVDHKGKLAVVDAGFAIEATPPAGRASWLELYSDAKGLHLVLQPAADKERLVEWRGAAIDADDLARAYREIGDKLHVDILAHDNTTAQTLVDMVVAAAAAGVAHAAVVEGPAKPEERRGQIAIARRDLVPYPRATPGQPNAQGDLDKALIRAAVHTKLHQIQYCYERELLARPHLAGTVMVQFFITPQGRVATANAAGMDPEVASCVAGVIRQIEFPHPNGGGGVQVNYPFTFAS